VHDLGADPDGRGVAGIHVVHLDGDIRDDGAVSSWVTKLIWGLGLSGSAKVTIHPWSITVRRPSTSA